MSTSLSVAKTDLGTVAEQAATFIGILQYHLRLGPSNAKAVRKHELIQTMAIKNATQYKETRKKLARAERHLAQLNGEADQRLPDLQSQRDGEVEGLFQRRHSLRTKAGIVRSRIKRIEAQKQQYTDDLEVLNTALEHIESELRRKNVPVELSNDKYKEIGEVAQRVELIRQQVQAWDASVEVREQKKETKKRLDTERPPLLDQLTHVINRQIAEFDASFYETPRVPPRLRFDENKKYEYGSPVDDGTGTSDKNLILFDLAETLRTDQWPL